MMLTAPFAALASETLTTVLMERCFKLARNGDPVKTNGLKQLRGSEAEDWKQGLSGRVYDAGQDPQNRLILIVPRRKTEPVCLVIHRGLNGRSFDQFMNKQKGLALTEVNGLASNEDGVRTRALGSIKGPRQLTLLGAHVDLLQSSTFFVHTQQSLGAQ